MRLRVVLVGSGVIAASVAFALVRGASIDALGSTWPPFVLVTGLLLIGVVANQDGLFAAAAGLLARAPGGALTLYVAAMSLVAAVTVFLNLDTSVAFLTPVLILVARHRAVGEQRLLYGCVFMSNAASLLLPGSNLTNLLVLSHEHVSGYVFFVRMWPPWAAAVLVTAALVAIAFRAGHPAEAAAVEAERRRPQILTLAAIGVAVAAMLVLSNAAMVVLAVGLVLAAAGIARGRLTVGAIREGVDVASLVGVFLVAVALGTLARTWSYPAQVMSGAGSLATAAIGVGASVLVNNLPAAVLLGSRVPAHPRSLLIGLNLGPNLAVTGSLSALIWWQAARSVGARPSVLRYSLVGVVLVPASVAAAVVAGHLLSPGRL